METIRGRRVREDVLDTLDELERRLAEQRLLLEHLDEQLGHRMAVYEAAKRYVLSPFVDGTEQALAADLERAVHAAIATEPKS